MRTHLIFIFQISYLIILSQNKINYLFYHKSISNAECLVLDSNYIESIPVYDSVISNYSFVFPKDIIIAAQVAAKLHRFDLMYRYLDKSISCGASYKRIKILPIFDSIAKTGSWKKHFEVIDSLQMCANQKIDWPVKKLADSLYHQDQILRDKNEKFFSNRYFIWRKKLHKKWQKNCLNTASLLDSLILKNKFPSYLSIGSDDSTVIKHNNYSLTCSRHIVILYHLDYCYTKYAKKLITEVEKGNLHAYQYALLRDMETREVLFHQPANKKECRNYYYYVRWDVSPFYNAQTYAIDHTTVDIRRKELGLIPYQYERKKKGAQNIFNGRSGSQKQLIDWFYYDL